MKTFQSKLKLLFASAVAAATPFAVDAQVITLDGASSNTCTYSSLSLDSFRNIVVKCEGGGGTSPAGTNGTIGFLSASLSRVDTDTSAVTVTVARSGYTQGTSSSASASATFSCVSSTGYNPTFQPSAGSGPLAFSGNQNQSFQIYPTALLSGLTSATVTCNLTSLQNASAGANQRFTLLVSKADSGGGGGGSSSGCTTQPVEKLIDLTAGGSRANVTELGLGTAAVKFKGSFRGVTRSGSSYQTYGTNLTVTPQVPGQAAPDNFATEIAISECAGDFNVPPATETNSALCRKKTQGLYSFGLSANSSLAAVNSYYECSLDSARDYYLNIRWRDEKGAISCTSSSGCAAYVDLGFY